jgi:hypothetical protein
MHETGFHNIDAGDAFASQHGANPETRCSGERAPPERRAGRDQSRPDDQPGRPGAVQLQPAK